MNEGGFFNALGEAVGNALRLVVELLAAVFSSLWGAIDSFVEGLTGALGINPSLLSFAILVAGVLCLLSGIRALLRRSIVGGLIWLALGMLVLGWLIQ